MRYPLVRFDELRQEARIRPRVELCTTVFLRLIALPCSCIFLCVCSGDMKSVIETYNLMSLKWFTHATPTLFNAGTQCPQLSSW